MSSEPTSLTLVDRVRTRDEDAWRRLVGLYSPLVLYWCGRWGVHGEDARDVAQEVFGAVAAAVADFRRDRPGDTFRGWLRGITRNKVLMHLRGQDRQPRAAGGTEAGRALHQAPDLTDAADPPEELNRLYHRALDLVRSEFEDRTWQMFWRATVDGHEVADVARDLGVTPAAVRQAKSRVLRRLKQEIGDLID